MVNQPLTAESAKALQGWAEAEQAAQAQAAAGMEAAAESDGRIAPETPPLRVFLSPQQPRAKFLVTAGKVVEFADPNSPAGKRTLSRDGGGGDVFAQFVGGVLATSDPAVIEWCEAHGPDADQHRDYHRKLGTDARTCAAKAGLCCDAADEQAEAWVTFKKGQIATANSDATIPPGMNVDQILTGGKLTGHAGGEGTRLLEAAEATRKAHEGVEGQK